MKTSLSISINRIEFQLLLQKNKKTHRIIVSDELSIIPVNSIITFVYNGKEIVVTVTKSHIEPITAISNQSALLEGVEKSNILYKDYIDSMKYLSNYGCLSPRLSFRSLWIAIYGEEMWNNNVLVNVVQFDISSCKKKILIIHE